MSHSTWARIPEALSAVARLALLDHADLHQGTFVGLFKSLTTPYFSCDQASPSLIELLYIGEWPLWWLDVYSSKEEL